MIYKLIARVLILGCLVCGLTCGLTQAQIRSQTAGFLTKSGSNVVVTPHMRAELMAYAPNGVQAGKPLWLGVQLQHQPGWHTYWKNPGDAGLPTQLTWILPTGLSAGNIDWPVPEKIQVGGLVNYGYEGTVLLSVPVDVLSTLQTNNNDVTIHLKAQWLVCKTECVPEEGDFSLKLPIHGSTAFNRAQFEHAQNGLIKSFGSGATATVSNQSKTLQLELVALPVTWQGKILEAFPEDAQIIAPSAKLEQSWFKGRWTGVMILSTERTTTPVQMGWLVKIAGGQSNPAVMVRSNVVGAWPEAASPPASPSPALESALAQNKIDVAASKFSTETSWLSAAFGLAILGALLGGLILNLMPCVLPVLAIKLLSFAPKKIIDSKSSIAQVKIEPTGAAVIYSDQTLSFRASSALFATGVVGAFTVLGALLLALRSAGQSLGWGFQLQSPNMVLALAVLFLMVGLNLFEAFELRIILPQRLVNFQSTNPGIGALASGVLAVLIAAPCTAPFMGASLGLAIVLPTLQALLIFVTLGVGMALPFIALALFPSMGAWLLRVLPRPGQWMSVMQQLLAWPVFATVLWLMWIYAQQTSINCAFAVMGSFMLVVALMWSLGLQRGWPQKVIVAILALALVASYGLWNAGASTEGEAITSSTSSSASQVTWVDWSAEKQQEARAAGRPVFVDFTAAWCLTCQVNKSATLHRDDILTLFKAKNVLLLRADWTTPNPKIAGELARLGRSGLPVYAFYLPGSTSPQLLPEVLTTDIIKQVLSVL